MAALLTDAAMLENRLAALSTAILGLPQLRLLTFVLFDDSRLRQRVPCLNMALELTAALARERPAVKVASIASTQFFAVTVEQVAALYGDP